MSSDDEIYLLLMKYIKVHILDKWKETISMIHGKIRESFKNNDLDYMCACVKTNPKDIILCPETEYWTFAFICTRTSPKILYYKFSNHKDGVNRRNYFYEKGYLLTSETPCIIGKSEFNQDNMLLCTIGEEESIKYTDIDWDTGKIIGSSKII